jgi:tetratricopeptide (TPR) repeat protein
VRSEQLDDALRICDRAIQMGLLLNIQSYIGNFYWVKAEVFQNRGDPDAALKAVRESLRLLDPGTDKIGQGQQTMGFVQALSLEGKILGQDSVVSLGRYEEAAASLGRSFTIIDGFVHRDTNDQFSRNRLADAGVNLGDVLRHFDARRSLDIYDHTLRHLAEVRNNTAFRRFEVSALAGSSYSLRRLGRPADARERLDAAFERLRQLKLYPAEKVETGSEAEDALRALAEYEVGTGNLRRATELYQNILDLTETTNSKPENSLTDALDRSSIYRAMSALLGRAAKADLASALEARDRDLWQQWDRKLPNNAFVHRQLEFARLP